MSHYRLDGIEFTEAHEEFQNILARAYANKQRPLCLCMADGVELYIAYAHERYWLKRMPNSGGHHHPGCESYEPPAELSGLGQVYGSAIKENLDTGVTQLKFDFRLAPGKSRTPALASETDEAAKPTSIKASEAKLGLRGLLHYLWEQSGWQRWAPATESRRNWHGLRKALLGACAGKVAKAMPLDEIVFIPETFILERKDEISARTAKSLACSDNQNRFRMLIGELKEIKPARFGHKLVIKHLPEHPFYLNDQTYKRMVKQFDAELLLWRGIESSHLIVIATFSINQAGYAELDNLSLMNVSSQWIPFETADELALIEYLVAEGRSFSKCLRYNLSRTKPLASAVLVDIRMPLALYIARDGAGDESADGIDGLIADSQTASYIWDPKQPGLPFEPQQGKPQIAYAATV
ncbi:DUF1173 domain-containing protein [Methylomonas koyamae]|uniref:DUF1173 domain-containing protein n=1 Tax=Methylomonas koyamae TaxID=702114 RepID=UPI001C330849|nr:DUF1173 domain-containing protein [Methylomonas koyamae]BBL60904.1 hypothetical protein MKFW12EY_45170 [Methylomonas koyamae]